MDKIQILKDFGKPSGFTIRTIGRNAHGIFTNESDECLRLKIMPQGELNDVDWEGSALLDSLSPRDLWIRDLSSPIEVTLNPTELDHETGILNLFHIMSQIWGMDFLPARELSLAGLWSDTESDIGFLFEQWSIADYGARREKISSLEYPVFTNAAKNLSLPMNAAIWKIEIAPNYGSTFVLEYLAFDNEEIAKPLSEAIAWDAVLEMPQVGHMTVPGVSYPAPLLVSEHQPWSKLFNDLFTNFEANWEA